MEIKHKAKGSWGVRFFIAVLGVVLGVLFFWLLNFVEHDIDSIQGPDWSSIRRQYVSEELDRQQTSLGKEAAVLKRQVEMETEKQRLLKSSTDNLQDTINQLLSIQQQMTDNHQAIPAENAQTLQKSQVTFLENQQKFQDYNKTITELTRQQQDKEQALAEVTDTIRTREEQAREEYVPLSAKHRFKVNVLKMTFLVSVFLVVSFFFMKFRTSAWWPLVWSAFIAAFIKLALVAHECFPTEYFKYVALLVIIVIVVRILVYLIRLIVAPKKDLLIKQYQQHYDKCICPVCSKPIRTGPLRYIGAFHKKARTLAQAGDAAELQPYTCPSCGTQLYDKCGQCGAVRHTLLPYCEHCGAEKRD